MAWAVTPVGRVCGTAIGIALMPDGQPDVEPRRSSPVDRGDEPLPLQVRLGAGEQQERRVVVVAQRVQLQLGLVVGLPVVRDEVHQRPAGAVVEELVDVEARRPRSTFERLEQVLAGQPAGGAGVDEAGERMDQHRPPKIGQGVGELK